MAKTSRAMRRAGNPTVTNRSSASAAENTRANENSVSEVMTRRTINIKQARADFIESRNPSDFLTENVPDSISINGVEFRRFSSSESLGSDGNKRYVSAFQAMQQAQDGTFPVFETVVKNVKKRGKNNFEFDTSPSGVKFW